jgi:hypothetical protein
MGLPNATELIESLIGHCSLQVLSISMTSGLNMNAVERFLDSFTGLQELYLATGLSTLPSLRSLRRHSLSLDYLVLDVPAASFTIEGFAEISRTFARLRHLGLSLLQTDIRHQNPYIKIAVRSSDAF